MVQLRKKTCFPKCKNVGVKGKQKCSSFEVPKKEDLKKKWELAISGLTLLKENQLVCENHFLP